MQQGRWGHAMERMPDGRVIVAGGTSGLNSDPGALDSVEVYDPKSDTWTTAPSLNDPRVDLSMAVLSNGVYVTGGENDANDVHSLASTERLAFSALVADIDGADGGQDGEAEAGMDGAAESSTLSSPVSVSSGSSCYIGRATRRCAGSSLVALMAGAMLLRKRRRWP
jgi:Kelch motif